MSFDGQEPPPTATPLRQINLPYAEAVIDEAAYAEPVATGAPHYQPHNGLVLAFGITGLVLGIVGFLFSMIPCFGFYAVYPGGLGMLSSVVAVYLAFAHKTRNAGLPLAAFILCLMAVSKGTYEWNRADRFARGLNKSMRQVQQEMNKSLRDFQTQMKKDQAKKLQQFNQRSQNK